MYASSLLARNDLCLVVFLPPPQGEEERAEHSHHLQTAQPFFPSCICAAVLPILHLLDDHDVNADGVSGDNCSDCLYYDNGLITVLKSQFLPAFLVCLKEVDRRACC